MDNKKEKSAFSLAEATVVLVIVAIIMAAAAPLIAKKTANNNQRPVTARGNNVFVAQGNNQELQIGGTTNSADPKLTVNGNTTITGTLKVGNNYTLENESNTFKIKQGENELFTVNNDNQTNVEVAIPDYSKYISTNGCVASANGYVYVENMMQSNAFIITTGGSACSTSYNTSPAKTVTLNVGRDGEGRITSFPALIPINKGTSFTCASTCYFFPLAKANTQAN